ncbi:general secretion pathway protein GspN [Luteimonas sp. 50]|uniref:General secretion pathway protein GspN n=1 Tax=Cognatiluteimonas sedimenti TaxID=2927791 RepID=A0ABT0A3U8_9GAMM|nr:general secretion pathway protein GspN [Lysobacter sedimenti]MCJ0825661.1 general secretion pathway protein GspN [Lysobacter sedimenti]
MRVDGAGPRTWLLATVAGWALLAWVLALAGMGGRAALLADDPGLLQPLPQPRPSPPERLGPLAQYAEIGARPLFAEDRRPHPFSLQSGDGEEAEVDAFDYVLTSVLITPQLHMAIVQPSQGGDSVRIKLGEAAEDIPAWRLVELNARSAVFEGPEGRKALDLRTFDGVGGASPTEVREPGDRADAGDANAPGRRPSPPVAAAEADDATEASPAPAANTPEPTATEKQMDAIRKRIEARRAQLRQEALQKTAPARKP